MKAISFKDMEREIPYIIETPKRKIPEDIAPRIKYFNPASVLNIEFLFLAIRTNNEKVCNSKAKYISSKCSHDISSIDPINTKSKRTELFKSFFSSNTQILRVISNSKAFTKYFQLLKDQRYMCQSVKSPITKKSNPTNNILTKTRLFTILVPKTNKLNIIILNKIS